MERLGFHTYEVKLQKGTSFGIEGVPKEVLEHFSKRREQVKAELTSHPEKGNQWAVLNSREKKDDRINRDECFKRWKEEAQERGFQFEKIQSKAFEKREKTQDEITQKVLQQLQSIERFRAFSKADVEREVYRHSAGKFSNKETVSFIKEFTHEYLHKIGSANERWRQGQEKSVPLHLRVKKEKPLIVKRVVASLKSVTSKQYRDRLSDVYARREALKEKQEKASLLQGESRDKRNELYTLNRDGKKVAARESLYSVIKARLSKPLQRILPEGKPLSAQYKRKQYQAAVKRFERRKKLFHRRIFFAYMTGKMSRSRYVELRDGTKKPKSKLLINLKWIFTNRISKKQRDHLIQKIDKQKAQIFKAHEDTLKQFYVNRWSGKITPREENHQVTQEKEQSKPKERERNR